MPSRLYKILLILGMSAAILSVPAFWFSYPLFENFFNASQADNSLEVDFLDVGQGDATLIKTPAGQTILVDGGPDNTVLRRLSEELPFWERSIDLVVLTHPHDDHVFGLIPVLERFNIGKILYTGVVHTAPGFLEWLELAKEKNIPMAVIDRPQRLDLGESCYLDILWPQESLAGQTFDNLNNSSIVFKLIYGANSFLFMGDAEEEVEAALLDTASSSPDFVLKADVLKVGHHGSDTSSSQDFLAAVMPRIAFIPVGADNQFGHPNLRVLNRLERTGTDVYRADVDGTVRLLSDGENITVQAE